MHVMLSTSAPRAFVSAKSMLRVCFNCLKLTFFLGDLVAAVKPGGTVARAVRVRWVIWEKMLVQKTARSLTMIPASA